MEINLLDCQQQQQAQHSRDISSPDTASIHLAHKRKAMALCTFGAATSKTTYPDERPQKDFCIAFQSERQVPSLQSLKILYNPTCLFQICPHLNSNCESLKHLAIKHIKTNSWDQKERTGGSHLGPATISYSPSS